MTKRSHLRIALVSVGLIAVSGLVFGPGPGPERPGPSPPPAVSPTVSVPGRAEAAMVYTPPPFRNSRKTRSEYIRRTWELIGGVGVNVVWINTAGRNVRFLPGFGRGADPARGYFPLENFYHTVLRYRPRVAINGTYFHLLNGQPTGAFVRNGKFLYDGRWGTTICVDSKGCLTFRYQSGTYGRHRGWEGVLHGFTSGPTLVRESKLYLHPRAEGFRDPRVLKVARRSALGITDDSRLVLVTVHRPISLNKLAHIMLRLKCTAAVNLDGGSSSALYCNGEFITKPSRRLSNVLLVYD